MTNSIRTYEDFLSLFPEKPREKAGAGWLVICPAHNDHSPSLWITPSDNPDFIADFKCHAGCNKEAVLKAKNLTWADVRKDGNGIVGDSYFGKGCQPVNDTPNQLQNNVDTPKSKAVNGVSGLTLEALAGAKKLPVDFLKSQGISDLKLNGVPVVRIPYFVEDGQEAAVRFRMALSGTLRFKWRKGDQALPYGLNRLAIIRKTGWVMIVEGESDCWTCWHHDIPALGAPGKSIWPASWENT